MPQEAQQVSISIDAEGFVYIDDQQVPVGGLPQALENAVEMAVIRSRDRSLLVLEDFPLPRKAPASARASTPAEADFHALVARFEPGKPPSVGSSIDIMFKTELMHFFDLDSGLALR